MRRLILHVGAPKCGSTFFQRVMLKNRGKLCDLGLNYPHLGLGHPGNGEVIYEITEPWLTRQFERAPTLILSHELLFAQAARATRLRHLVERMEVQVDIVAFLRPFDEIVLGDYSQTLLQNLPAFIETGRAFHGRSFRQFAWARQKDIQPAAFLAAWQAALPSACLHLAQHRDIRATLNRLIPATSAMDWTLPAWRTNPSLSRIACEDAVAAALSPAGGSKASIAENALPFGDGRMRAWLRDIFDPQRYALIETFGFDVNDLSGNAEIAHAA